MFFFRSGLRVLGLEEPSFNWLFSSRKHTGVWLVRRYDGLQFFCRELPVLDCMIQSDFFEGKLWAFFSGVESGTFIDVGAHIGKYTVKVGKKLEGTGQVFAVEPEAGNFALLQRNVAVNRLGNVTCLKCACFSENAQMKLFLHRNSVRHALHKGDDFGGEYELVQACTIDSLVEKYGIRDVRAIKIDVEGAEFDVLKGAQQTLSDQHPSVVFESTNVEKCEELLRKHGYEIRKLEYVNYLATRTSEACKDPLGNSETKE